MVTRKEPKDAEAMERRRKRHAPFFIPSMIFRQIAQTQGWRSAMPYSGISARGFAPAPESGENAKTGRMSPNDSPAPGPSGSISLREAAAQKGLSGIMRRNIPALSGLIRTFPRPSGNHVKAPERDCTAEPMGLCRSAQFSGHPRERGGPGQKAQREGEQETRSGTEKPLP